MKINSSPLNPFLRLCEWPYNHQGDQKARTDTSARENRNGTSLLRPGIAQYAYNSKYKPNSCCNGGNWMGLLKKMRRRTVGHEISNCVSSLAPAEVWYYYDALTLRQMRIATPQLLLRAPTTRTRAWLLRFSFFFRFVLRFFDFVSNQDESTDKRNHG